MIRFCAIMNVRNLDHGVVPVDTSRIPWITINHLSNLTFTYIWATRLNIHTAAIKPVVRPTNER